MTQVSLARILADFETSLSAKMAIGATSGTILSATDDDGVALPSGRYFFTIDGNNSSKEHISCVLNGTSLTSVKTVSRQGTETSGTLRAHRVGAKVVLTDFKHIKALNDLLDGTTDFDPSVVLKYSGTATNTADTNEFATVKYVDGIALASAPDATTSSKGVGKVTVAPAVATNPLFIGDNDPRVPTQDENDAMVGTVPASSSTNLFVTNNDTSASATTAGILVRRNAAGDIKTNLTPTETTDVTSKSYVDGQSYLTVAGGLATRTDNTSSGSQAIAHGLGRTPKQVKITAVDFFGDTGLAMSTGLYTGTSTAMIESHTENSENGVAAGSVSNSTTNMILIYRGKAGAVASQTATVSSVDSTNINLSWTLSGSMPGNIISMLWEAQ